MRAAKILDSSSWRGWDGKEFSVVFTDPYLGPVARPQDHVYTPVPYMAAVNAINFHEPSHLFVATLWDPWNNEYGTPGLYLSTSTDLVHWTKPVLVARLEQFLAQEPAGSWSYAYFSLLDRTAPDLNFSMIGGHPDLYYVRFDNDGQGRVLYRQGIELTPK